MSSANDSTAADALSDVDDSDVADPSLPSDPLAADLEEERRLRRAADDARAAAEANLSRVKAAALQAIRMREAASKDLATAASELAAARADLSTARADLAAAAASRDALQTEIATASSMLISGIERIAGKISAIRTFEPGGLPKSQKYASGMPAVAYGAVKRANEVVEELLKHLDSTKQESEQRNYETAIEISKFEATISGLRRENEGLEKLIAERDGQIAVLSSEIADLKRVGDDWNRKVGELMTRLESHRPVLAEMLTCVSDILSSMHEVTNLVDGSAGGADMSESMLVWKDVDTDENLKALLGGMQMANEFALVTVERVRENVETKSREIINLNERISELIAEKQHIGVLLKSALLSDTNEVLQAAKDGLKEAGIELSVDRQSKPLSADDKHDDEVYTLAGALENTVKESQVKIIELQHLVEAQRAELALLRGRSEGQAKEISQLRKQIKELEEKERAANENVEGLMMDISAAGEEIARWKMAAEQEAAAGRAIEEEYKIQISALRRELDDTKQAMMETENKLRFKEETAAAAMAARAAAENSLRLADQRSARLRQRVEELTRQLEESDNRDGSINSNSHRYVCWPWQWLGLNSVRYNPVDIVQNSNEMELSEPLM